MSKSGKHRPPNPGGVAVIARVQTALRLSDRVDDRVWNELAVENADLLLKAQAFGRGDHAVKIAARVEHFAGAVPLRADNEVIGLDGQGIVVTARYPCGPNNVTLIIRCMNQRALR